MKDHVGLDVAVRETGICVVDAAGKAVKELKVITEPTAIATTRAVSRR